VLEGRTIVEQGEGESPSVVLSDTEPEDEWVPVNFVDPTPGLDELAHFARFSRIAARSTGSGRSGRCRSTLTEVTSTDRWATSRRSSAPPTSYLLAMTPGR
jgi:hypothetical protein